jgi:hypothetical protein
VFSVITISHSDTPFTGLKSLAKLFCSGLHPICLKAILGKYWILLNKILIPPSPLFAWKCEQVVLLGVVSCRLFLFRGMWFALKLSATALVRNYAKIEGSLICLGGRKGVVPDPLKTEWCCDFFHQHFIAASSR